MTDDQRDAPSDRAGRRGSAAARRDRPPASRRPAVTQAQRRRPSAGSPPPASAIAAMAGLVANMEVAGKSRRREAARRRPGPRPSVAALRWEKSAFQGPATQPDRLVAVAGTARPIVLTPHTVVNTVRRLERRLASGGSVGRLLRRRSYSAPARPLRWRRPVAARSLSGLIRGQVPRHGERRARGARRRGARCRRLRAAPARGAGTSLEPVPAGQRGLAAERLARRRCSWSRTTPSGWSRP